MESTMHRQQFLKYTLTMSPGTAVTYEVRIKA
jgi:hypothetical protein